MIKYLVIDSGGTKTAAILYGEDLRRIAVCTAGSLRSNTTPDALYESHAEELCHDQGIELLARIPINTALTQAIDRGEIESYPVSYLDKVVESLAE